VVMAFAPLKQGTAPLADVYDVGAG
jgi:hypothetical protein